MDIRSIFLYNRKLKKGIFKMKEAIKDFLFSIAGLAIVSTTLCFLFFIGYFEFFNINPTIIFLNKMFDYFLLGTMAIYISIPFISVYVSYKMLNIPIKNDNIKETKWYQEKEWYKKTKRFFINIIKKIKPKKDIIKITYYVVFNLFSSILIWILSDLYTSKIIDISNCNWLLYLISVIIIIVVILYNEVAKDEANKLYFITCLFFLILAIIYRPSIEVGYNYAKAKKNFIITNNYILVYNTSEYGIGCKYEIDEDTNIVTIDTSKYVKMDINGLVLENKSFEKVSIKNMK